mmetsp:Transcript_2496/g.5804  ORF Transcript_2496/g.5804 Transcript_2496/m.5804 type:complete len:203 (-) Transcript_2496:623-1231(-)
MTFSRATGGRENTRSRSPRPPAGERPTMTLFRLSLSVPVEVSSANRHPCCDGGWGANQTSFLIPIFTSSFPSSSSFSSATFHGELGCVLSTPTDSSAPVFVPANRVSPLCVQVKQLMAVVSNTLCGFCLLRSSMTMAPATLKNPSNETARYLSLVGHILMSDTDMALEMPMVFQGVWKSTMRISPSVTSSTSRAPSEVPRYT